MVTPIASNMIIPNHSGDVKAPTLEGDIANKKYVDDHSGGAPEGTAVKSTGELITKFLRADGDGTSSWQTPSGSGDMTKAVYDTTDDGVVDSAATSAALTGTQATAITNNTAKISFTEGAAVTANTAKTGITSGQASAITANTSKVTNATHTGDVTGSTTLAIASNVIVNADINSSAAIALSKTALVAGTNITLSTNTLNVDDSFLKNDASDTTTGTITAAGFTAGSGIIQTTGSMVTGDHGTATTDQIVNVCYGTSATPPTASTTTEGTIYIQYTA